MSGPKHRVEDGRPGRFWVDDALVDSGFKFYSKLTYCALARKVRGNDIKLSHADLAQLTDLSVSSVRRGLDELETAGWLEVTRTEGLKVENTYRLLGNPALIGQPEQSSVQGERTDRSARTSADRSARTNRSFSQNDKATTEEATSEEAVEAKQEVNHPPVVPHTSRVVKLEYPEAFEALWKALPEKAQACGKKAAFEKWKKALKDGATVGEIMAGLEQWKASRQWAEGFVNHATTWLNQERWKVQPEPASANRPASISEKWAGQKSGLVVL